MPQTQSTGLLPIWVNVDAEYTDVFVQSPHSGAGGRTE
jgi:hypothetical protein